MPIRAANLCSLLILPRALGLSFLAGWQLRGEPQQVDQVVNPPRSERAIGANSHGVSQTRVIGHDRASGGVSPP
jgi:hypothetical protein